MRRAARVFRTTTDFSPWRRAHRTTTPADTLHPSTSPRAPARVNAAAGCSDPRSSALGRPQTEPQTAEDHRFDAIVAVLQPFALRLWVSAHRRVGRRHLMRPTKVSSLVHAGPLGRCLCHVPFWAITKPLQ